MLKLWGFRYSTNADRIVIALELKGVAYEEIAVDPADRTPMLDLTGQPLVPAIELDGEVTWDSPRILERLDERFPDPPLYPRDPARRAEAEVFLDWFNRVWKIAPNRLADEGPDPGSADALARHQDRFEALLGDGRPFLLGDFGIAEVTAWPFLRYAVDRDPGDTHPFHRVLREHLVLEGRPHLASWIERVPERLGERHLFGAA